MTARFFGQFLVERGVIDTYALLRGLEYQSDRNTQMGALAVREGLLAQADADRIRTEQQKSFAQFGEVARQLGLLTDEQVVWLFARQQEVRILLGEALVAVGVLDDAVLKRELAAFEAEQAQSRAEVARANSGLGWATDQPVPTFVELTSKVLRRATDLATKEGFAQVVAELPPREVQVGLEITGGWRGHYVLRSSTKLAKLITARMLIDWPGSPPEELVPEAIKELVGAIGRQSCVQLDTVGLSCVAGEPRDLGPGTLTSLTTRPLAVIPLTSPEGAIEVCLIPAV